MMKFTPIFKRMSFTFFAFMLFCSLNSCKLQQKVPPVNKAVQIDNLKENVKSMVKSFYKVDLEKVVFIEDLSEEKLKLMQGEIMELMSHIYLFDGLVPSLVLMKKEVIFLNTNGDVEEKNTYDNLGGLENKVVRCYDNKGRVIEEKRYKPNTFLEDKKVYSYDEKDNLKELRSYSPEGVMYSKSKYHYNDQGVLSEMRNYNFEDRLIVEIGYDYSVKGIQTKNISLSGEEYTHKETNKLNKNADIIEKSIFNPTVNERLRTTYTYEYDSNKNWIKQITLIENIPIDYIIREITYHK